MNSEQWKKVLIKKASYLKGEKLCGKRENYLKSDSIRHCRENKKR